jgi:Big-like domain-containing protein/CHRD domain-containing protein
MDARHSILMRLLMTLAGALIAMAFTACGGGYGSGGGGGGGNVCGGSYVMCPPPTVSISAPVAGATVSGTVAITALATASSTYSLTIASVQFFVDGTSVGTATASPYTVNWNAAMATNGSHSLTAKATDSMNDTATSTAVMVTVTGGVAAAAMSPAQIFPTPSSRASGMARISVDPGTGAVNGTVSLSGITARSVTINQGFAGSTGEAVVTLAPRAGSAREFVVPANVVLDAAQAAAFARGGLYVLATSAANPRGEIRGQLAPESVRVTFSELSASPEAAALGMRASGIAATTVDTRAATLTVHVNSAGVENATAGRVLSGAAGTALAELARDPVEIGHFSTELARISAADVASFEAGRLSVSVEAGATPAGAIRGPISSEATAGD